MRQGAARSDHVGVQCMNERRFLEAGLSSSTTTSTTMSETLTGLD